LVTGIGAIDLLGLLALITFLDRQVNVNKSGTHRS
jgi:hypothetical protein